MRRKKMNKEIKTETLPNIIMFSKIKIKIQEIGTEYLGLVSVYKSVRYPIKSWYLVWFAVGVDVPLGQVLFAYWPVTACFGRM